MVLSISVLGCKKDNTILINGIPEWLNVNISGLESQIKADTDTIFAYTAWVRYEWKNNYYFEYLNFSSSSRSGPTNIDGRIMNIADPRYSSYEKEKCCMEYIWKGPYF